MIASERHEPIEVDCFQEERIGELTLEALEVGAFDAINISKEDKPDAASEYSQILKRITDLKNAPQASGSEAMEKFYEQCLSIGLDFYAALQKHGDPDIFYLCRN